MLHNVPRPILLDDKSDRPPQSNGWHQSLYGPSYGPNAKTKDHEHPIYGMHDSYKRPISSMSGTSAYTQTIRPASSGIRTMAQQALHAGTRPAYASVETSPPSSKTTKLFNGEPYSLLVRELQLLRQSTAILHVPFNNQTPSGPQERVRQLDKVLHAEPSSRKFTANSSPIPGRRCKELNVEPPFRCEYGTNIRLGDRQDSTNGHGPPTSWPPAHSPCAPGYHAPNEFPHASLYTTAQPPSYGETLALIPNRYQHKPPFLPATTSAALKPSLEPPQLKDITTTDSSKQSSKIIPSITALIDGPLGMMDRVAANSPGRQSPLSVIQAVSNAMTATATLRDKIDLQKLDSQFLKAKRGNWDGRDHDRL